MIICIKGILFKHSEGGFGLDEAANKGPGRPRSERVGGFGKWLKRFCIERDMMLKDAAAALGCSMAYLVRLENAGVVAPMKFLTRLMRTFVLTAEEKSSLYEAYLKDMQANLPRRRHTHFDIVSLSDEAKNLLGCCMALLPFLSAAEAEELAETLKRSKALHE